MIWLGLMLFSLCLIAAYCIDQWFDLREAQQQQEEGPLEAVIRERMGKP